MIGKGILLIIVIFLFVLILILLFTRTAYATDGTLYNRCYPNRECGSGLVCDWRSDICILDTYTPISYRNYCGYSPDLCSEGLFCSDRKTYGTEICLCKSNIPTGQVCNEACPDSCEPGKTCERGTCS